MSLEQYRSQIDDLDHQLLELLRQRAELSAAIGREKTQSNLPVYDPQREEKLLQRLTANDLSPLTAAAVRGIYREIMSVSRALQQRLSVAFLGPEHTFSHLAALKHFGSAGDFVPQVTIEDVFQSVERGQCSLGVVPIENTIQGVETRTLDAFVASPLLICGEVYVDVHLCLLSNGPLAAIRRLHSHPQPLAQCRTWLRTNLPDVELIPQSSTSAAAAAAAQSADGSEAALATAEAGRYLGLQLLAANVEDQPNNRTRFFVISPAATAPSGRDKTSVLFTTPHQSGALYAALAPLSAHQINLTLIQSRPVPAQLQGPYIFYVDFDGHQDDVQVREAVRELERHCRTLKVLGSYPSGMF
jgi:chorismate mutase / prephenate dehydratase